MALNRYGALPITAPRAAGAPIFGQVILVAGLMLFAASVFYWYETRGAIDPYPALWSTAEELDSYHYTAIDQDGGVWEMWFQAPGQWLLTSPAGVQFSDGRSVIDYDSATNTYARTTFNPTFLSLGLGPLGPRTADQLKPRAANGITSASSRSLTRTEMLGVPVDRLLTQRGFYSQTKSARLDREVLVDPRYRFLLSETVTSSDGEVTRIEATSIEYNPAVPADRLTWELPPGACLKVRTASC